MMKIWGIQTFLKQNIDGIGSEPTTLDDPRLQNKESCVSKHTYDPWNIPTTQIGDHLHVGVGQCSNTTKPKEEGSAIDLTILKDREPSLTNMKEEYLYGSWKQTRDNLFDNEALRQTVTEVREAMLKNQREFWESVWYDGPMKRGEYTIPEELPQNKRPGCRVDIYPQSK